jgi:4'-phosphopantetheinyl transferase EntD
LSRSSPASIANPARLSALSALFSLPVVAAELELPGADAPLTLQRCEVELLTAREWASIRHCAERRILDFCSGRACARRALQEYGVSGFDLLSAEDRQPLWPNGFVGSIAHTEGFAAAVVAESRAAAGLGIDVERIGAVHSELWPPICTAAELERLQALSMEQQLLAGALTFVAKEAFFKCQYPLAAERFGFDEVELEQATWSLAEGEFRLQVCRSSRLDRFLPADTQRCIPGRYTCRGPYLIGAVALSPLFEAMAR